MRKFPAWKIKSVQNARHKLRAGGKSIVNLSAEQLGFHAITHGSDMHRMAAVAELVRRLQPAALEPLLNSIPVEAKPASKPRGIQIGVTELPEGEQE
jgi:hypothetical protein